MKKQLALAPVTALGLLLGTTSLYAQSTTTSSVAASVQGALQAPTGFLTGGQVQVTGVGQGSVVLTREVANVGLNAGAAATISDIGAGGNGGIPSSQSAMVSQFDFSRNVETGGALVGVGNVVAQGESLGGIGIVGSSNANATRAGTRTLIVDSGATSATSDDTTVESAGSSSTPTTAQGSLVGDFTTTNTMQLTGSGSLFAGAQTLSIGERNSGVSAGRTGSVTANATSVTLNDLVLDPDASTLVGAATGGGAGFSSISSLLGSGGTTIDLNASNAGNGTVLVSGSTGGFFGQGTSFGATVAPTFSQVNGFFTQANDEQP